MKITYDLVYLNENKPEELPDMIIIESNVIPRKDDTIDFDDYESFTVDEVRFKYKKTADGFEFDDVYVFLKTS
jgi:hypothetical protein